MFVLCDYFFFLWIVIQIVSYMRYYATYFSLEFVYFNLVPRPY